MASYADPAVASLSPTSSPLNGGRTSLSAYLVLLAGFLAIGVAVFIFIQTGRANNQKDSYAKQAQEQQVIVTKLQPVAIELANYSSLSTSLHGLFDNQKLWEQVLVNLEPHLYKQMTITNLALSDQGTLTLSGVTHNYVDYAKIFASFTDANAKQIYTSAKPTSVVKTIKTDVPVTTGQAAQSVAPAQDQITFTFTLTLDPKVFKITQQ